jgi:hypothetical protein
LLLLLPSIRLFDLRKLDRKREAYVSAIKINGCISCCKSLTYPRAILNFTPGPQFSTVREFHTKGNRKGNG